MRPLFEPESGSDPKRARILDGALKVFLAYGYSRTTMDDIARAANVSRPALYLVFRNKTDIYRAIASSLLAESVEAARAALGGKGPFAERLSAAIDRAMFQTMAPIERSPHGAEIMDMKNSLAADLIAEWRAALTAALEEAIAEEAERRGAELAERGLSPGALAEILIDGLEGMKMRGVCGEGAVAGVRRLVTVIETALGR